MSSDADAGAIHEIVDHNILPPSPVGLKTILNGLASASNGGNDSDGTSNAYFYMPADWAPHSACLIRTTNTPFVWN
jgi:hypothetical protein